MLVGGLRLCLPPQLKSFPNWTLSFGWCVTEGRRIGDQRCPFMSHVEGLPYHPIVGTGAVSVQGGTTLGGLRETVPSVNYEVCMTMLSWADC